MKPTTQHTCDCCLNDCDTYNWVSVNGRNRKMCYRCYSTWNKKKLDPTDYKPLNNFVKPEIDSEVVGKLVSILEDADVFDGLSITHKCAQDKQEVYKMEKTNVPKKKGELPQFRIVEASEKPDGTNEYTNVGACWKQLSKSGKTYWNVRLDAAKGKKLLMFENEKK